MAYEDATNYNTVRSMKAFPVGTIIPWAGEIDTIPYGWITCNGSTSAVTKYPLLYDVIGTTYGGTTGTSFRIPSLNDGSSAIMDIYQGHFNYLQSAENAHKPENTVVTADSFWNNVGKSDNGNRPSSSQTNWVSTIDVVGEQISFPDLVARHETFALSEGEVSFTLITSERKLSDLHVANHSHDYDVDGSPSYNRGSSLATKNSDKFATDAFCHLDGTPTTVCRSTNDSDYPVTGRNMDRVGSSNTISTTYRAGGGDIINDQPTWDGQNRATGFSNGDGFSGGDMYSHLTNGNSPRYFFTSLSHDARSFSQIPGHAHGSLEYNWISKVKIINPGIVSNVKINTVRINSATGLNFGSINMNSATPSLSMIFIIRAF